MARLALLLSFFMVAFFQVEKVALAKAYYASKSEMISNSEIIAVVEMSSPETTEAKGMTWTYKQKASVVPVRVLKGTLPAKPTIYGGENFICATCPLKAGKALVFLNHDNKFLVGSNWHYSIRPIDGDKLDWYDSNGSSRSLKMAFLAAVITEVEAEIGADPKLSKLTGDLKIIATAGTLSDNQVGEDIAPQRIWNAYTKTIKNASSCRKELEAIFKNGTPAGRIYAAMLLYHADKEAGKKALATLSTCNGTVTFKSGCEVMDVGVWQVASDLYTKNKYLSISLQSPN